MFYPWNPAVYRTELTRTSNCRCISVCVRIADAVSRLATDELPVRVAVVPLLIIAVSVLVGIACPTQLGGIRNITIRWKSPVGDRTRVPRNHLVEHSIVG
jgi:hypothetical protein